MEIKGVCNSKLKSLYTAFLHSTELSEYKMGITFDKNPVAVKQNNYAIKIVKFYIAYDSDAWPRNPTKNFKCKNCLFGATSVVKNSDKEKYMYGGYWITFDSESSWGFDNGIA